MPVYAYVCQKITRNLTDGHAIAVPLPHILRAKDIMQLIYLWFHASGPAEHEFCGSVPAANTAANNSLSRYSPTHSSSCHGPPVLHAEIAVTMTICCKFFSDIAYTTGPILHALLLQWPVSLSLISVETLNLINVNAQCAWINWYWVLLLLVLVIHVLRLLNCVLCIRVSVAVLNAMCKQVVRTSVA